MLVLALVVSAYALLNAVTIKSAMRASENPEECVFYPGFLLLSTVATLDLLLPFIVVQFIVDERIVLATILASLALFMVNFAFALDSDGALPRIDLKRLYKVMCIAHPLLIMINSIIIPLMIFDVYCAITVWTALHVLLIIVADG